MSKVMLLIEDSPTDERANAARFQVFSISWCRRRRSMTGREPCLHVSALDLDDALELYVLELSAVAGGIHD